MKRSIWGIIFLSFLLLQLCPLFAQVKVVDQSAKKVPVWVNSSETDYIITSAIKDDMESAKNQCLDNVRKYIIESVAENVTSKTEGEINQTTMNNEIVSFLDQFKSTFQTQAADVPFLKGISASRIEAYYWEKRQDKTTKEVSYLYSIKYPFPAVELKRMIREFEKRDKEMYDKFKNLESRLNEVASLEEIDRSIAELGAVIDYFFDDTRKNAAKALQQSYRKLYDNITFRTLSNELGEYKCCLILDGRVITTSQRLTLKSEVATQLTAEYKDSDIVVTYNYDGSAYDEENAITVYFRFGGKSVPHKFFYTVKKYQVEIWPEKTLYLTETEKEEDVLMCINVRMNMKSAHKSAYRIKSMTLDVPGLSEPLFFDDLDKEVTTKEATITLTWTGKVKVLDKQYNKLNLLKGNMDIEIPDENINKRVDFSLSFKANW
ncbi:hypothetical protein LJB85_03005 [Porphyromonadaceae bacterium OttesenSCG-928-L07]|nr:hypothetical protein [Porphyromonadaceae bacterium OttesenSCG-928-L07]MDL2251963.1 hypothetical protein [Odoribacter sp. OttesenSCG-928-J03]MDL2283295.1 hypothetical protein [Odoribacter sp. OttesenSCG-928-G04]